MLLLTASAAAQSPADSIKPVGTGFYFPRDVALQYYHIITVLVPAMENEIAELKIEVGLANAVITNRDESIRLYKGVIQKDSVIIRDMGKQVSLLKEQNKAIRRDNKWLRIAIPVTGIVTFFLAR